MGPGSASVSFEQIQLPSSKEEVEQFVAERFVRTYNETHPIGEGKEIRSFKQQGTENLDFVIESSAARYLELTEFKPFGQRFEEDLMKRGRRRIDHVSDYIHEKLIGSKQIKYGQVAEETFLLIYSTQVQLALIPYEEALTSYCYFKGCRFAAVFLVDLVDQETVFVRAVHPWQPQPSGPRFPQTPIAFRGRLSIAAPLVATTDGRVMMRPGDEWPTDLGNGQSANSDS